MLSTYLTGRNANQGDCAHPCRYSYALVEEKRPGQYFPVEEDSRGTYIFNSRDLCLLQHLPSLIDVGVDAIKIEGRMKSVGYVASVVRVYRQALDWLKEQISADRAISSLELPEVFHAELAKTGTRGQTENFFNAPPSSDDMLYDTMRCDQQFVPAGIVRTTAPFLVESRHVLMLGDVVEYLNRTAIESTAVSIIQLQLEDGTVVDRVNPGTRVIIQTDPPLPDPEPYTLLRKSIAST